MRHECSPATAEEIVGFCSERLAQYKGTKEIRFVEALPKSPLDKILKNDLRARAG